jgi:hypothetical protein
MAMEKFEVDPKDAPRPKMHPRINAPFPMAEMRITAIQPPFAFRFSLFHSFVLP